MAAALYEENEGAIYDENINCEISQSTSQLVGAANASHGFPIHPNKLMAPYFVSGIPVRVIVITTNRPHWSNQIWYSIKVEHGPFQYTLHKQLKDLLQLELSLDMLRVWRRMPVSSHSEEYGFELDTKKPKERISSLPFIMATKELEYKDHVMEVIENYLKYVVQFNIYRNHAVVRKFFEISGFSFNPKLGRKRKEGFLKKESPCCLDLSYWAKRWFILKDSFLMYLDSDMKSLQGVLLFDNKTEILPSNDSDRILNIKNSSFSVTLKCLNINQAKEWKIQLEENLINFKSQFEGSELSCFAPQRCVPVHWFVDGCSYFSAVAEALESAREEIYITDFVFGPNIYLKRKPKINTQSLLKSILKRKADEGVKIYILINDDMELVDDQGHSFVKEILENLNKENIRVIEHGGRVLEGSLIYAHHEKLVIIDQNIAFVSGLDLAYGRWDVHQHPLTDIRSPLSSINNDNSSDEPKEHQKATYTNSSDQLVPGQLWPGIDYANDFAASIKDHTRPFEDNVDRHKVHRMPWHDIGAVTYHEGARDVARHFIERWNYIRATEFRDDETFSFLLPKSSPTEEERSSCWMHPDSVKAKVQVVRSAAEWSVGLKEVEMSIQDAYVQCIDNAQHYIYIENQYFISIRNHDIVTNKIAFALYRRILKAKIDKQKFRVYVVLPLAPAFEGDFSQDDHSEIIQMISHYIYKSISRGDGSLLGSLLDMMTEEEIRNYISFCSLRSHGELEGKLITEVLYVHSKMLIVDDRIAIIGSANINDRSLAGDRDSEVGLLVEDTEMVESVMDGKKWLVGKFASTLRKRVFAEHLGLLPSDFDEEDTDFLGSSELNDVISDEFYHSTWNNTAATNTKIYSEVFRTVPSDYVRKFSQMGAFKSGQNTNEAVRRAKLRNVKGHLVKFPQKYLEDEDLELEAFSILNLLPVQLWT